MSAHKPWCLQGRDATRVCSCEPMEHTAIPTPLAIARYERDGAEDEIARLRAENAALRKVVDEVPRHILSTISLDQYEDAEYVRAVTAWRKLRDATL